ncbi:MAG: hypothetical protein K9H16_08850 [Bacteroidales bacterium]|nr:hypothetical protein [Bacteroidales bacterium]
MKIAFTTATINYLPRAFTLASSFLRYNPAYDFHIFLIDPYNEKVEPFLHDKIRYLSIEDMHLKELQGLTKNLSISEISFSLKPILCEYLLRQHPEAEYVLYFDGDICFYHQMDRVEELFETCDLILTPHFTHPVDDDKTPTELDILRTGLYNMGFAGFRNTPNVFEILAWWKNRVLQFGLENHDLGLSADQMWMSLAPLFFNKAGLLDHPGCNFAYWNIHERRLTINENRLLVNNEYPLIFVHFADFDPNHPEFFTNPENFNRTSPGENLALDKLCEDYAELLKKNHFRLYHGIKSKYAVSQGKRALNKMKSSEKWADRIKFILIFLVSLFPRWLKKGLRNFSLFILRNIK